MEQKPPASQEPFALLSPEHHTGLLFCWKIRQGLKKKVDTRRIQPYALFFWDKHLRQHFREEEIYLFEKVNDDYCWNAMQQHRNIRASIHQLKGSSPAQFPDLLTQLADAVEAHIRYEERELFPHLEKTLNKSELLLIGAALEQLHTSPVRDNFPDEFWVT
ncbi:hypothetical protein AAE02nite_24570 [Adhaeribacter aerolatus]|uniref:Hemerythrin-like domain-containing protein n=1 Tax=Adhaeribacter aerolatus TaxID=670289 RepID=A0A512AYJ9_9BACT|nr:hemerythrin domain-containing protein [Adhaeribacter aerolatus]GEO04793.1 hypothetical protein AAE02nite_24570 [Adhaeribacter aerolatus]